MKCSQATENNFLAEIIITSKLPRSLSSKLNRHNNRNPRKSIAIKVLHPIPFHLLNTSVFQQTQLISSQPAINFHACKKNLMMSMLSTYSRRNAILVKCVCDSFKTSFLMIRCGDPFVFLRHFKKMLSHKTRQVKSSTRAWSKST